MSEIADRYDPTRVEPHWYAVWEERGYFHADAATRRGLRAEDISVQGVV